ncbi:MAG: hypothetical protein A2W07_07000 [candidate division Zixibacteria bacterium RBG_16_43_9]|nr:MAG: hypothetical protein A2W07_07000 [candidate division Zixibacteria bacterium RBG_16_43_9]
MADIYAGIGGLKRINSQLIGKANPSRIPIEKTERASALDHVKLTPQSEKIPRPEIKSNNAIYIAGDKDKKIRELICQRLACEKAIRLKQEIKNFSSAWLTGIS